MKFYVIMLPVTVNDIKTIGYINNYEYKMKTNITFDIGKWNDT